MPHPDPAVRDRAFTLIELLVVIGIITILIGILLPMLGKARSSAKRTQCLSQVRQLQAGVMSYTNDNDEYPRVRHDPTTTSGVGYSNTWNLTNPFDAAMDENGVTAAIWLLARQRYLTDIGVFSCPSTDSEPIDTSINPTDYADFPGTPIALDTRRGLHYGYTNPYGRNPGAGGYSEIKTNVRLTMDKAKPGLITFADQGPDCCLQHGYGYSNQNGTSINHGYTGMNVAKADGSAEWEGETNRIGIVIGDKNDNIYMGIDEPAGEFWTWPAPPASYDDSVVTPHFDKD